MKNIFLSAAALVLLGAASCSKTDEGISNGWVLNNTSYTTSYTTNSAIGTDAVFTAVSGTAVGDISFVFTARPTVTSTYKVGNSPLPGQVKVVADTDPGTTYNSTGNDNIYASVSVVDEKLTIHLPSIWVKNIYTHDSVRLAATIIEM